MSLQPDGECPFCGRDFRIYEPLGDDDSEEHECPGCDRKFIVTASVRVRYKTSCLDTEHEWEQFETVPGTDICSRCCKIREHK